MAHRAALNSTRGTEPSAVPAICPIMVRPGKAIFERLKSRIRVGDEPQQVGTALGFALLELHFERKERQHVLERDDAD